MRMRFIGIVLSLSTIGICLSHGGEGEKKFASGPAAGAVLPGPFDMRVVNGDFKGKQHCVVCEHRLFPVILTFFRDPGTEWKDDGPLAYLLDKMEEAVSLHELAYVKSGAVFLSPNAQSSATAAGKKEAKDLVEEAKQRELMLRRVEKRAEKYKNVTVGIYPAEGPKGYKINPDAEVTIVFFNNLKVVTNQAFAAGKMTKEDVDRFMENLDKTIRSWKASPKKS